MFIKILRDFRWQNGTAHEAHGPINSYVFINPFHITSIQPYNFNDQATGGRVVLTQVLLDNGGNHLIPVLWEDIQEWMTNNIPSNTSANMLRRTGSL